MSQDGVAAEKLAAEYLKRQGLVLIISNYRCRFGEIDLVMRDRKETVFVEVRLRSNRTFGGAAASITASKQKKLIRTAEHYLMEHGDSPCRFDAVLLDALVPEKLTWLKNAFEAS